VNTVSQAVAANGNLVRPQRAANILFMELAQLSARALEIREHFAALERNQGGRPWTREEVMQGFVGDVGDLMKLVMAKSGIRTVPDADSKLAHELSDCLWSVLVIARLYHVDLEKEFLRTMDGIEQNLIIERGN
jgi:NTP pyrophosphatase (non-canonical NTP hydrolase)